MSPPFTGITVLDLTQIYNGPYATFLLAQGGADVIKIEPPGGEHLRKRQGASGAAMPFAMLNANKRAMTLNLKRPQGRELLLQLVRTADVLVENFAPGVMERLDIGERRPARGQSQADPGLGHGIRQIGALPRLSRDGSHRASDGGRHRHHRLRGCPTRQVRAGDGRLPGRHPSLRRHRRRALRARAHGPGQDGGGLDDGGGLSHARIGTGPVLRQRGQPRRPHRKPAQRPVSVPVQRVPDP